MTSPLDELRAALATIDRESAEATPGPWAVSENSRGFGVADDDFPSYWVSEPPSSISDATLIVNAVALYRETVRDIIAEAIEVSEEDPDIRYEPRDALRLARAINARTEGAS